MYAQIQQVNIFLASLLLIVNIIILANFLWEVNNRNNVNGEKCEIRSKITLKTPERRH